MAFLSGGAFGQSSTFPAYQPVVDSGYFYGDTSTVYPNPYSPAQHFQAAEGESRPVPNRELRARSRSERFATLRSRLGSTPEEARRAAAVEDVPMRVTKAHEELPAIPQDVYPEPILSDVEHWEPEPVTEWNFEKDSKIEKTEPLPVIELPSEDEMILLEPEEKPKARKEHSILESRAERTIEDSCVVQAGFFDVIESESQAGRISYPTRKKENKENRENSEKPKSTLFSRVETTEETARPLPLAMSRSKEKESGTQSATSVEPVISNPIPPAPLMESTEIVPMYQSAPPIFQRIGPDTVTVPYQRVFESFDTRHPVDRAALPWYARYIRDMEPNEARLFNVLRNSDQTEPFSLMEACILASHPKDADVANRLINQYYIVEQKLLREISSRDSEIRKAEKILTFMHREVLTGGYRLEQTSIENLFEYGRYNCVTATVLFCCLGRQAGLNVVPVELPGHAMCWMYLKDGTRVDVETTCKTWFEYQNNRETQNRVICDLIRSASGAAAKNLSEKKLLANIYPISDKRLIAKIYYNRGVDLLAQKDFAGALEANAVAYILDPKSETTHGNLLATMNNWAIALCEKGEYPQAAELLSLGIEMEPEYYTFRNNHVHVYHRWVESLYRTGRFDEALAVATQAASEQPEEEHFRKLQDQVNQGLASSRIPVVQ